MPTPQDLSRRRFLGGLGAAGLGLTGLAPLAWSQTQQIAGAAPGLDAAAQARPVAFLDRIGWGASAAQLEALAQAGPTAYLNAQLQPQATPGLPELSAQLAALPVNQALDALIPPIVRQERDIRRTRRDGQASDAQRVEVQLKAINRFKFEPLAKLPDVLSWRRFR
ncbi:MAG: twin-arginine translocation signal domain-containing protein [Thiomonas sp.]